MYHYKLPVVDAHIQSWQQLLWSNGGAWFIRRAFAGKIPEGEHHAWGVFYNSQGHEYLVMPKWAAEIRYYAFINVIRQVCPPILMPQGIQAREEYYVDKWDTIIETLWDSVNTLWKNTPMDYEENDTEATTFFE